jgi:GST-like protein
VVDVYLSSTPNGLKIRLFLEELAEAGQQLAHRVIPVRLSAGEQFAPAFLAISPNNKIPAIVDHAPADGGAPLPVFESGAILLYLAEKTGLLLPSDPRARIEALQWLFWQVSGLGPMAGQAGYFRVYAPHPVPEAIGRYTRELARLYRVLDRHRQEREWIAGDANSNAVSAAYPWIVPHAPHGQYLDAHPHLRRWFERIAARPATRRAYTGVEDAYAGGLSESARTLLYGTSSTPA